MTKDPRAIVARPLVTEKNHVLQEEQNKYVFEVARDVNKLEVKRAIEEIFDVQVPISHSNNFIFVQTFVLTRNKVWTV